MKNKNKHDGSSSTEEDSADDSDEGDSGEPGLSQYGAIDQTRRDTMPNVGMNKLWFLFELIFKILIKYWISKI